MGMEVALEHVVPGTLHWNQALKASSSASSKTKLYLLGYKEFYIRWERRVDIHVCALMDHRPNTVSSVPRAVASLTVPGGQEFHFPNFFLKLWSIFPQTLLFSSSFWPSGWATGPPGKALATPLSVPLWNDIQPGGILNQNIIGPIIYN